MSIVTQDFVAAGKPTYIVANAGVMYTDITDGVVYKQTTIPFGKNWKVVSNQNVYTPDSGVTEVNVNAPLVSTGGDTPTISMPKASASKDGYLTAADWNMFNAGAGSSVTAVTATTPLQSSGGTTPDISIPQAGALTDGFLSSADWGVFNGKFPYPTGTTSQYVRGDGSLATFPTVPTVTPAALTKTDDTNITLALTGTPTTALLQAVNIAVGWSGTLADSRIASASTWNSKVSSVGATGPITSSGGTTPTISTSMATNKLIGRGTAGTGVMEEITVGTGLLLFGTTLSATVPTPTYLVAYDTNSQTAASPNVGYPMTFDTTVESSNISFATVSAARFTSDGVYNIQFSAQFSNYDTQEHDVDVWFVLNGSRIDWSNSRFSIIGTHGGVNGHYIAAWNYMSSFVTNDEVEIYWQTDDILVQIEKLSASGDAPDTPSIILTIDKL